MICILPTICFAQQEKAVSCLNFFSMIDYDLVDRSPLVSTKSFVSNFCKVIAESKCVYDDFYFDASQSVFLSILCSNV